MAHSCRWDYSVRLQCRESSFGDIYFLVAMHAAKNRIYERMFSGVARRIFGSWIVLRHT